MTSASSIAKPWSSDAVRQGVCRPRNRRRRSRRRPGRRGGGGCRRPAPRSARPSPTAGCAAPGPPRSAPAARRRRPAGRPRPRSSRTTSMIELVSACGMFVHGAQHSQLGDGSPGDRPRAAACSCSAVDRTGATSIANFLESIKLRSRHMSQERIEPYVWKIAGVVILGMMMSILDTTIVNVALDTLGSRPGRDDRPDPVGGDRIPAGARGGDPAHRLGGAALRRQAGLPRLDRPLHHRLGALRPRRIEHHADPLPRPAGRRRRHDHAGRADDHGRGRGPEADGPGDEHRR